MKNVFMTLALAATVACTAQKATGGLVPDAIGDETGGPAGADLPGSPDSPVAHEGPVVTPAPGDIIAPEEPAPVLDPRLAAALRMEDAIVGGAACPAGSFTLALTNAGKVEIKTAAFNSEVSAEHRLERKACTLAIPLQLAENERLVIQAVTLTGSSSLREKATAVIDLNAFTGATTGNPVRKILEEGQEAAFTVEGESQQTDCGARSLLRLNASTTLQAKGQAETSTIAVEGVSLTLKIEACE